MKKVKLGEIVNQIRGVSYKPEDIREEKDANAIAILRANNITDDGKINYEDMVFVDSTKVHQEQILTAGDILICASSGSKNLVGKACYIEKDKSYSFGAFCKVARPKDNVYKRYLAQFFQSPNYRSKISELSQGANINNIKNEHINKLDIAIYSIKEQKEIADRLDKVSSLIEKRKEQLAKLDQLIKSRFIEMFTPFLSQGKTLLDALCETITKGTTPTTLGFDFIDDGINFIKIENISANEKIDTTNMLHISEECNIKLKRSILKENDILFSIAGTKMGITAKVTSEVLPANTNQALAIIRLKKEAPMNVDFLIELLHSDMIIEQIESMKSTVAQTNLSLDNIKNFKVIVPPISLQNEFAEFVKLIDKSKLAIQKSIDKLETLKKSLMQQYFG